MEFNASSMPFWDISQTPMTLSQIADDDFLTLLQKQFPTDVQAPFDLSFPGYNNPTGVNPQSLSDYTIPISQPTSSSSDSSNSPASTINDNDDRPLKRKASDERMDVEPTPKTVHTGTSRPTSYPLPFPWAADTWHPHQPPRQAPQHPLATRTRKRTLAANLGIQLRHVESISLPVAPILMPLLS